MIRQSGLQGSFDPVMEVLKADWLCHLQETRKGGGPSSIFTISVDSSGKRLASAGLDSTIRVWNLDALEDPSAPKLLAAMTRHDGAVLCLKWSPEACQIDYLASAADDSIVLIWRREAEGPALGGAFDFDHDKVGLNRPVESYRVVHRLTDHRADVAGLEWSPDGRWLASCGLDSNILIWDVQAGFKLVAKLEGHKGFVKGLAWDPLGVYLASQSDDHTMIIWRTKDWQYETMLKKPFDQANEETFFRRPSWSPDGAFVAAANAVNGRQPVVSLISRDQWKPEIAFVGHLLAVEVARFSPFLYRRGAEGEVGYLCAAGSQDCNTSLWSDKNSKPLALLTDLFEHAVMDIEWLLDGTSLLIAAYDGTIAKVILDPELVGRPFLGKEQAEHLASLQTKIKAMPEHLPASLAEIKLKAEFEELKEQANVAKVVMGEVSPLKQQQVETRTKAGKRRIAPLLMQPDQAPSSSFTPAANIPSSIHPVVLKAIEPVVLQTPTIQDRLSASCANSLVEVLNNKSTSETRIRFLEEERLIWEDSLDAHALVLLADEKTGISIAALQNRTLLIFSLTGRRLSPPLILQGTPIVMSTLNGSCLTILETGQFFIWDFDRSFSLLSKGTIAQLATKGSILSEAKLLANGSFRVSFVDGRAYDYVARLEMFVTSNSSIFQAIEYDGDTSNDLSIIREALAVDPNDARLSSIKALESRLSLAALQADLASFELAFATYIRRLATEGMPQRIIECLTSLAGSDSGGFAFLGGVDRRRLLLTVRPLLAGLPDASLILSEIDTLLLDI